MKATFPGSCPAAWGREQLHPSLGATDGSPRCPSDAGAPGFNCRRREHFALIRRDKNSERQAAAGGVRMKGGCLSSCPFFLQAIIAGHAVDECHTPPKPEHREARASRLSVNERGGREDAFDPTLLPLPH